MDKNILYQNLDMLSVMESCDDNSVDLILVFMPPNMGGTVGESALRPFVDEEMINDLYKDQDGRFHRHINRRSFKNRQWDYGDCYFINEESFDAYMDMTKKVIQNAGRVLKKEGMLLMSQVIQCASDNGWDNSGDMEDAVHALISLAVKSHAGSIVGDEAEKWFGEGWELLSAQCKNYLQTAAAYDKISQQNGNADCAPIGIEFYRALEHELNRTLVNDLFAYIKENSERVKEILENTEQSNDMKRIASTMSAILNDETVRGLTLGEIYQSLKAAAASSDKDVGGVIAECCRERGYANLLSHDNVGLLGMAAQLRNLCAHPSDIDGSFMGLNLQIVRRTLKEQQVQAESQCDNNMSSVCAIIGPDNNKMKYPEDTTNMKAAIKSLILMFYKSGIRQYASTGNSGFDLLVADVLKECRQSGEAKSIKVVEYLPCERDKMKFAPNRKKRVLAIDKFATIEVCGDADNAANKSVCQEKALENAAFCIAFYAEDGQSAIANRVKDAMQKGTIVYNTYGII